MSACPSIRPTLEGIVGRGECARQAGSHVRFWPIADMDECTANVRFPGGVKQTWLFAMQMFACDPKRTWRMRSDCPLCAHVPPCSHFGNFEENAGIAGRSNALASVLVSHWQGGSRACLGCRPKQS